MGFNCKPVVWGGGLCCLPCIMHMTTHPNKCRREMLSLRQIENAIGSFLIFSFGGHHHRHHLALETEPKSVRNSELWPLPFFLTNYAGALQNLAINTDNHVHSPKHVSPKWNTTCLLSLRHKSCNQAPSLETFKDRSWEEQVDLSLIHI